jgi:hypothetical protein
MVDARIPYAVVVKFPYDFLFFLKSCAISKATLVKCIWMFFKLDFYLHDDTY